MRGLRPVRKNFKKGREKAKVDVWGKEMVVTDDCVIILRRYISLIEHIFYSCCTS